MRIIFDVLDCDNEIIKRVEFDVPRGSNDPNEFVDRAISAAGVCRVGRIDDGVHTRFVDWVYDDEDSAECWGEREFYYAGVYDDSVACAADYRYDGSDIPRGHIDFDELPF